MAQWSFIAQTRSSVPLGDLAPFLHDRNISLLLNRPSTVTASINLNAPTSQLSWLQPGQSELVIRRDGIPLETVFVLTSVDVSAGKESAEAKLEWQSISTYLRDLAVLAGTTQNVAQSLHAWNLINTAQGRTGASVYAITRGAVPGTDPVKQTTYDDAVDVLTAIENLSERADGFDFGFDTSRQFNVYYPYRGQSTGLTLEYNAGGNLQGFGLKIDAGPGKLITDLASTGGNQIEVAASDTSARAAFGRREAYVVYPDFVTDVTALQSYANADLNAAKSPIAIPQVTLSATSLAWGSYGLGDQVNLRLKAGSGNFVNINAVYRITSINIGLNELDSENIALELNEARLVA